jgi:hypothetical protein
MRRMGRGSIIRRNTLKRYSALRGLLVSVNPEVKHSVAFASDNIFQLIPHVDTTSIYVFDNIFIRVKYRNNVTILYPAMCISNY